MQWITFTAFPQYQLTMNSREVGSFEDPLLDHSPILGGHLDSNVATSCFILRGEVIKGEKAQRKGWKMMEV